ncbi:MAG: hypothetical protein Q8O72_01380 [Bacteroidales bacterium]|nr:hypothetical protein [Bacteroidales bacterium]
MENLKLYWEFHKSTLLVNWLFSVAFSMILVSPVLIPVMSMSGGPLLSIFYKQLAHKNEFYFYYNQGISKIKLIVVSLILNVIVGLFVLIIIYYVKYT